MKKLVIVGSGEFAEIANEYFTHDSSYDICAFSVDEKYLPSSGEYLGYPIVAFETIEKKFSPDEYEMFIAVPSSQLNRLRTRFYEEGKKKGYKFASYISSKAFVWRNAEIGENCFIFEHNTIQPFVRIGNNCVLWSGNHIGHRTVIHDNCFLTSHVVVSGYCEIGAGSFLGVNSTFNDFTSIGESCIVGSGALVTKKLTERESLYMGSPAKKIEGKNVWDIKL
jgi:sugar O-acyltransferase (sialic acid O-acetyltransferase NeuD family)